MQSQPDLQTSIGGGSHGNSIDISRGGSNRRGIDFNWSAGEQQRTRRSDRLQNRGADKRSPGAQQFRTTNAGGRKRHQDAIQENRRNEVIVPTRGEILPFLNQ